MTGFKSKKLSAERHSDAITMDDYIRLRKENEELKNQKEQWQKDERKYQMIISKLLAAAGAAQVILGNGIDGPTKFIEAEEMK